MPAQTDFFNSVRVTSIMRGLNDPRLLPTPLIWNSRVPDVPATDEEISAKYMGVLQIADLIADDAKAVTYSTGRFEFQTVKVPNIKMGIAMNQAMINSLERIRAMGGVAQDEVGFFTNRYTQAIADCKFGVEIRKEVLKIAMLLDGFSYNRLGIIMTNLTWGMYSDLKVTPGTAWTSTSGTGISDIQSLRNIARQRYGVELNRATMATATLRALVAQTEFQAQVKTVYISNLLGGPAPTVPLQGDANLRRLVELVIAGTGEPFTIEIDDRRYWSQAADGTVASARFFPLEKVLLTATANDGNANAYDFANCIVTEGIVANIVGGSSVVGQVANGRGPIGYVTLADTSLNPPGIVTWGVARGFPRKHLAAGSAVLSIGSPSETFDTTIPSPL